MDDKEPLTGFKKFAKTPYGFAVGILIASICTIILYYLNVEQTLCGMGFVLIAGLIYIIMKRFGINLPFSLSIADISENEGMSQREVKAIIDKTMTFIADNISEENKKILFELL